MIGFVYILTNEYMPDVYKVGCTERSPHERASEISKGTGVPAPFEVLCYIEIDNFQNVERELHAWLKQFRISEAREFFCDGLNHAIAWLWWRRGSLGFHGVPNSTPHNYPTFIDFLAQNEIVKVDQSLDMHQFDDPWDTPHPADLKVVEALDPPGSGLKLVASSGDGRQQQTTSVEICDQVEPMSSVDFTGTDL